MVDFSGLRPRFRIYAEAEKGRQDRLQQPLLGERCSSFKGRLGGS
jgi:hypothetical protein